MSDLLLQAFDRLAQAPGGVGRLRELILSLAVQGKLTDQDQNEEPAAVLLERIQDDRLRLTSLGAIKLGKQPPEVDGAEPIFNLPKGWTWARLGELCGYVQRGKGPTYAEQSEHKVISQKCVRWYGLDLAPARFVTPESLAKYEPVRFLRAGDLLWNSTGTGTIGRACVVPIELDNAGLVADSHVTVVRPLEVNSLFLWRWIQSRFVQDEIEGSASGTTNQIELNTSTVVNQLVPVPPLAEQARIVARVDELMRLCDALEAKGRLEAEQHSRLLDTLLSTLTDSATSEELTANWQRVAEHFDLLLDRPEAVDALEQTVLQLAVRGLLVSQHQDDEPASVLLRRIHEEKESLAAAGKIKRDKASPTLAMDEVPFGLPDSWVWSRLGTVAKKITDGTHHSPANFASGDFKYLSAKNIKSWGIDLTDVTYVPTSVHQEIYARCDPEHGDILYIKDGATTGVLTINTLKEQFSLLSSVGVVKPSCGVTSDYLALVMRSPFFYQAMRDGMTGVAITRVTLSKLGAALVPLPPLTEQARIVARVTELRRLCADLRQRLAASQSTQSRLAEALVESVASA